MSLLDGVRSVLAEYRPRRPQLRPTRPVLWMIDSAPEGKPLNEFQFVFLVWENDGDAHLLANRIGTPTELHDDALVREVSQERTEIGSRKVPVRVCRLLAIDEARFRDPDQEDDILRLPDDVTGVVMPERRFTPEDSEELAAAL